jgi:hypothetical protein
LWNLASGAGKDFPQPSRGTVYRFATAVNAGHAKKSMDHPVESQPVGAISGRGLWLTSGDRTPWHKEGGKGTKPLVVHFQVRPSPLAD